MPDVQEVFHMATQKVKPDPGALERQDRDQRRRTVRRKAGVFALVGTLVVAGGAIGLYALRDVDGRPRTTPAASPGAVTAPDEMPTVGGAPPTVEQLTGIWFEESQPRPFLVRFSPDGTFATDTDWSLDTAPWGHGSYEVDGHTVTFAPVNRQPWAFEIGILEDGRLHVVVLYDENSVESSGTEWTWVRVSPSSVPSAEITADLTGEAVAVWSPPTLRGIWLLEGTGYLLRIGLEGSYAIDGEGELGTDPMDVGVAEVDEEGSVTLTSGPESRTCAEGDVWTWSEVELYSRALRGIVTHDGCARAFGPEMTWVQLSS